MRIEFSVSRRLAGSSLHPYAETVRRLRALQHFLAEAPPDVVLLDLNLHGRDGSRHLHAKTLSALERLLPDRFVRVHRSAIVDLDEAVALESEPGSRYFLRLADGTRVRVGRTRVEELRARMV